MAPAQHRYNLSVCRTGSLEEMNLLLESGAHVDDMLDGWTALHWAAKEGFKEKLALLLQVIPVYDNSIS